MTESTIPPELRWACRRGMLELDVLLGDFLEEAYEKLSVKDQHLFKNLLASEDQDLFVWLTGKEKPKNADFIYIVEKVRHHARNKNRSTSF